MGIQEKVEPMLSDIRIEAAKRYERFLSNIPDKDLHADAWVKTGQEFTSSVEDLLHRFREFYVLDSHDFATNVAQLATPGEQKQRSGVDELDGKPLVTAPSPGTAFAAIASADANFMRDVAEMIHTEQWNSSAATQFRDNFLEPFGRASDWQGAYVKELAVAAQVYRETVDEAEKGITFVAESCLAALRDHPIYPGGEKMSTGDMLTAAGIITGAIGMFLPASAGALIAGGASLFSGIASAALATESKPVIQVDYSENPQAIIRNTEYAIRNLRELVFDVDEALARGLDKDLYSSDAFASPYLKLPPAGVGSDTYRHLDIRDGDGKPPNQVVVSVVKLARAGYYNLPAAAYEYDAALAKVDAARIPGGVGSFFPRSISLFNSSCDQLIRVLRQIRDDLTTTGAAMSNAARTYDGTDEERAQILREIGEIPPHHSAAPVH